MKHKSSDWAKQTVLVLNTVVYTGIVTNVMCLV